MGTSRRIVFNVRNRSRDPHTLCHGRWTTHLTYPTPPQARNYAAVYFRQIKRV